MRLEKLELPLRQFSTRLTASTVASLSVAAVVLSACTVAQAENGQTQKALEQNLIASGVVGTLSVEFAEVSSAGKVQGCSLIYKSVFPDMVYQNGRLNVAVGNITFNAASEKFIGLSLKIGIRPFLDSNAPFERPNFAYIKTSGGSTVEIKQKAADGEEGYKLFAFSFFDPKSPDFFKGLIDDDVITVAFNRKPDALDQKFEIDFRVEDIDYKDGKMTRKNSSRSKIRFVECVDSLLKSMTKDN